MKLLTLKNRSSFENAVFAYLMVFGGVALSLTAVTLLYPTLAKVTSLSLEFLSSVVGAVISVLASWQLGTWGLLKSVPTALLAGAVGLLLLFTHLRYWKTSTWGDIGKSHFYLISVDKVAARLTPAVTLLAWLTFAYCAYRLSAEFVQVSVLTSLLGVMATIFVGLLLVHQGTMSDWKYTDTRVEGYALFGSSILVGGGVSIGGWVGVGLTSPLALFFGAAVGFIYILSSIFLLFPEFEPKVTRKEPLATNPAKAVAVPAAEGAAH